jgi:hypothetical protein
MMPCAEKESLINIVEITNPSPNDFMKTIRVEKRKQQQDTSMMIIKRIKKSSKNILLFLK